MIQVNGLSYEREGKRLLKDISFSIPGKGIYGVLGPKDSGKTLLLELLAGVEHGTGGTVEIDGQKQDGFRTDLRSKIGYVSQEPAFYSKMTVSEWLDFVGETRRVLPDKRYRQIEEALTLTDLSDKSNCLTDRLFAEERKKLSLAAALLGNTEILLLDEPFWGNTEEKRRECMELFRMLGKHKTVLLATRNMEALKELCDRLLLLSDGMLLADNSFEKMEEQLSEKGTVSLKEIYAMLTERAKWEPLNVLSEEKTDLRKENG